MADVFEQRTAELQRRMADDGIDAALIVDPDAVYYLARYWGYAGLEIGRPTLTLVPQTGDCTLITPLMESEMARNLTWISDVRPWQDGIDDEWRPPLRRALGASTLKTLGIEVATLMPAIGDFLSREFPDLRYADITRPLGAMRMIKTPEEIAVMRQAGQVAVAMTAAAETVIGEGVPEYEVALAVIAGGTRKAAEFIADDGLDAYMSPTIYNLQILNSGTHTCMVHRRSTVRRLRRGDPIYLCFCGIANFKHFKLGFDREYFVTCVTDAQARTYETSISAQLAALATVRPGVPAEEVHHAAQEVYRSAGFAAGYRTGRAIGYSMLERPEIKNGDRTPLQAGMTFAIDGGITIAGEYGARVGDSVVVTETGFEYLTPYPKDLRVL